MGPEKNLGRILIITGLSGSGKSTALNALEDCGFFCIDNLPVRLLPKFLALKEETRSEISKLAVVMDMREKEFVQYFADVFDQIKSLDYDPRIVFLEASDEVLVKRFSETRRRHPLDGDGSLLERIRRERELMRPVREAAQEILDTTSYNGHALREVFCQKFGQVDLGGRMSVEFISFGYKFGLPPEADIIMDVRFLPNPFYLDDLRELDGRDERIVEYVLTGEDSRRFLDKLRDLLDFVIPLYRREGKSYLTIAVGCTGGQHRSVTIVNELARRLKDINLTVRHRDIIRRRDN
ncbi:MAG: RNase adapter RapZ [Thermodesulfobacteriota bacterium]